MGPDRPTDAIRLADGAGAAQGAHGGGALGPRSIAGGAPALFIIIIGAACARDDRIGAIPPAILGAQAGAESHSSS